MDEKVNTGSAAAAAAATPSFNDPDKVEPNPRADPPLGKDQELFFINGDEDSCENLAMYQTHGYHPIVLGDVLPKAGTCETDESKAPRYRIIQKLGFGAFSTVWLARDILESRYVAVKVCCGTDKPVFSRETNILRHIQHSSKGCAGFDNVLALYEAFIISGPNGWHECLVTEVVAPLQGLGIKNVWSKKDVVKQIASAVSLLHSQGIAHGDLHQDNFGVALSGLHDISEDEMMTHFQGEVEVIPVVPRDPLFPRDTVPAYATPLAHWGAFLQEQGQYPQPGSATFKLLDYGRAFSVDQTPRQLPGGAPFHIRPPEVILYDITEGKAGSVWSKEADIWALGCAIYPGYMIGDHGFRDFYKRLANALLVGGPPPGEWLGYLDYERLLSSAAQAIHIDKTLASTEQFMAEISSEAAKGWEKRAGRNWETQHELFIDLLQRMVTTVPGARLDIAEVLAHSWLSNGP
ncbi:hypothetical protein INS49_010921 [Diaporthe citri]|uniref:uncharacterized protein n=1 Tax=Diaporthe citri TaxID=83186 RepID=UPI001C819515|nr:uncharacterized protein INS49_010921 [Diaporthe citri]KAG6359868.1 hypothetical protein INS49_010921 [Diaporthe citri]